MPGDANAILPRSATFVAGRSKWTCVVAESTCQPLAQSDSRDDRTQPGVNPSTAATGLRAQPRMHSRERDRFLELLKCGARRTLSWDRLRLQSHSSSKTKTNLMSHLLQIDRLLQMWHECESCDHMIECACFPPKNLGSCSGSVVFHRSHHLETVWRMVNKSLS